MSLAILLWLCTLPLMFLFAIMFQDIHLGWIASAVSFVVILLICMGICAWSIHKEDMSRVS